MTHFGFRPFKRVESENLHSDAMKTMNECFSCGEKLRGRQTPDED